MTMSSSSSSKSKRKEVTISCMLNTEIGSVLAVMRRSPFSDPSQQFYNISSSSSSDDPTDYSLIQRFKSLRTFIFDPPNEWSNVNPSEYLSPFLEVIQSYDVPATATGVAISSILKILNLGIFDHKTPGAGDIMNSIAAALFRCRLEKSDSVTEEAVIVRILLLLVALMKHKAYILLKDHSVCTIVQICFQVIRLAVNHGGDMLRRCAGHTLMDLVYIIYGRLPEIEMETEENTNLDDSSSYSSSGFGFQSAINIFQFLCSLLHVFTNNPAMVTNAITGTELDGYLTNTYNTNLADLDVQIYALVLINSAIELSGESMGSHPKLLGLVQEQLFNYLIQYGTHCNPHVLSLICSIVLNIYHLLRRSLRLQLEAFFTVVLFKAAKSMNPQIQEVAIEAIVNFFRQPTFTIEMYMNYDCSIYSGNVFEEMTKLMCKNAFPGSGPLSTLQLQSFEGLAMMIHSIAENVDKEDDYNSLGPYYPVDISTQGQGITPFWEEISREDIGNDDEKWTNVLRIKKQQKKKLMTAGNHFSEDVKKGLKYIKYSGSILGGGFDPPNPKAFAIFFRYTPGLDKNMIGDFLGDPEEFNIEVLQEFTNTFEFSGMLLDAAMRCFLETFKLPGESQKISRILEIFSGRFYEQSSDMFASKDVVFVLGYSVIMLNTDLHNPQVKKKMTLEEFIKNNRSINGGNDLPREYLLEIFNSIQSKPFSTCSGYGHGQPQPGKVVSDMEPHKWAHLVNQSKVTKPYAVVSESDFDRKLGRDMLAAIAGPSIATVATIFEHSDDENVIHECVETLFSIARIAQYQLQETLDELICVFCKFTTLLNPYASPDETLFAFSHDMKPRIATLAVFNIANNFKDSIRDGWRSIVDCLLKLKKLKLLPPSVIDPDASDSDWSSSPSPSSWNVGIGDMNTVSSNRLSSYSYSSSIDFSESGKNQQNGSSLVVSRFQDLCSMESVVEESLNLMMSEFEQNVQIIQQCHIETFFSGSSSLSEESLRHLGRYLIFAASGKGQKFTTAVEEEEVVSFYWDLIASIGCANTHRLSSFWPQYHEYLQLVTGFPFFTVIPFLEKAFIAMLKICSKLVSMNHMDRTSEELIFISINQAWKIVKDINITSPDLILNLFFKIIRENPGNIPNSPRLRSIPLILSTMLKSCPDLYEPGVEEIISILSDKSIICRINCVFFIDCVFAFIHQRNSSVDKNIKIMDLMCEMVKLLVQWQRNEYIDPDSSASVQSGASNSSTGEENFKAAAATAGGGDSSSSSNNNNNIMNILVKVGEIFRMMCLSRREEIKNYAVLSIQKAITFSEELCFTPVNSFLCFKKIVFPMVEDIKEKVSDYVKKGEPDKEISMENTLKIAISVMCEVYVQLLNPLSENPQFRVIWIGVLRRMENYVKTSSIANRKETHEFISSLLKNLTNCMKEKDLLIPKEGDDLWELTYVQIQRISPSSVKELLT